MFIFYNSKYPTYYLFNLNVLNTSHYYLKIIKLLMTERKKEITPYVQNYRLSSSISKKNYIEFSMIISVIASTLLGIIMNPIVAIAQDTLF